MYGRQSNTPTWFVVIAAIMLVFGAYFIWRGFLAWADANFSFPVATASNAGNETSSNAQSKVLDLTKTIPPTASPTRACQQFRVKVLRARVRECPKETCNTITLPEQGAVFCVIGVAPDATDWYKVNLKPDDPLGEFGYMSNSVLSAVNPTPRPSATLNLATVTPVPSTPTLSPPPSVTAPLTNTPISPAVPPRTQVPTKTPVPHL